MASDIEIARAATMKPITEIGARLDIPAEALDAYGRTKAKVRADFIETLAGRPDGKLILVTAINPTPAGEGKTTTTVGLGDGLNRIGKKAALVTLHGTLGQVLRSRFAGWRIGLITTDSALARATRLPFGPPGRPVDHGGLKVRLYTTGTLK